MLEPAGSPRLPRARAAYESSVLRVVDPSAPRHPDATTDTLDGWSAAPFADGYASFRERALGIESVSASLLAMIAAQAEALALVWEAHARGAVTLPPPVAAAVRAARSGGD